jgi:hypothetical protein
MGVLFASLSSLLYGALDVLRKHLGQKMAAVPVAIGLNMGAFPVYIGARGATRPTTWDGTLLRLPPC